MGEDQDVNLLKRRDKAGIDLIENSIRSGPLADAKNKARPIERRTRLTPDVFENEFRRTLTPVVIEGLLDEWPALKKWSFGFLAEKCGDARVVIDSYDSAAARETSFADFVTKLAATAATGQSPIYLQEWLYRASCPQLAEDLPELAIAQYDYRQKLYGEKISTNHQLWIGQKGATTRLHQDSYLIDVMHAQIMGEKHWFVMSPNATLTPDKNSNPDFSSLIENPDIRMMQCVLRPGDVLYLPALWWHRIELQSDSIGLGRKCLDEVNVREHIRLRLAELMALALNHEQVKQAHPELYKVVILRNLAWAKLLDIDLTKLRP